MNKLSKSQLLSVSLMLFSMFFGAGNLIFPTMIGYLAGSHKWIGIFAFSITAVLLPILALVAVSKQDGFLNLADKVHPCFALIFPTILYLLSGPLLSVPRAGIMPFETSLRLLFKDPSHIQIGLLIYSFLFFLLCFGFCIKPQALSDRVGKILTPLLLLFILILFGAAFVTTLSSNTLSHEPYLTSGSAFASGFVDGYLTLDGLGALNLGILVTMSIKSYGLKDEQQVRKSTIQSGVIAGILLFIVYCMLGFLGNLMSSELLHAQNGAEVIARLGTRLFGNYGPFVLGMLFFLACLTTCVGLISCSSEFFAERYPRLSYRRSVSILCFLSFAISNIGLTTILKISGPILACVYPAAIVLILLGLSSKPSALTYRIAIISSTIFSIIMVLDHIKISIPVITQCCRALPFYSLNLGWVVPTFILAFCSLQLQSIQKKEELI
ncbi:branched-chain amino acid transport system II carrier protein [Erysipelothrix sp. strain 2 (EsS2-6-Brazil)]|uniref:branched-chain amino acid transport system II carrier protein n=1 Tax=Erysipelothrix sp. strain 2 (EsS2-6-Brazil) TaxID=2500549 RepID=UPI00190CCAA3|nr:branched-chain amino acid transport system II carrier protein [Erysipelothrix sp. strain 2 (EsS2-6-Brazil)]MBK2402608.1 branched-chain amino acid transport system II carrier protein [Erysipelothrix sp. strain 2 (EsS2-6-Brazil)]